MVRQTLIHQMTYMADLAIVSRSADPAYVMGERGPFHEMVHQLFGQGATEPWDVSRDRWVEFEDSIPGIKRPGGEV